MWKFAAGFLLALILGSASAPTIVSSVHGLVTELAPPTSAGIALFREAYGSIEQSLSAYRQQPPAPATGPVPTATSTPAAAPVQSAAAAVRLPANVVALTASTQELGLTGGFTTSSGEEYGTGFAISPQITLTAQHVVRDAVDPIVWAGTGRAERILATDPGLDVAALVSWPPVVVDWTPPVPLNLATTRPAVGSAAWALCRYSNSAPPQRVQLTVVYAGGQQREALPDGRVRPVPAMQLQEVSGEVHPGCSGAPVVDAAGQVIGLVVTRSSSGAVGVVSSVDVEAWLTTLRLQQGGMIP